jgi:cytochrome b561
MQPSAATGKTAGWWCNGRGSCHAGRVRFLRFLIDLFVNTFGITPPTPETERRAGRTIAVMLIGVLVLLLVVAWALREAFVR